MEVDVLLAQWLLMQTAAALRLRPVFEVKSLKFEKLCLISNYEKTALDKNGLKKTTLDSNSP